MPNASARRKRLRLPRPRGGTGLFSWSFFDPANLVSVGALTTAAWFAISSMRDRGAPDWYMPIGLYLCLAVFLRSYIFWFYHGRRLNQAPVLLVLVAGLAASAWLWEDRTAPFRTLRDAQRVMLPEAPGFHVAALLHLLVIVTLFFHFIVPRRWLARTGDDTAEASDQDDES